MKFSTFFGPAVMILILFTSIEAHAAAGELNSSGLLDDILKRFSQVAEGWRKVITSYATYLFWSLVLISMVWTFAMLAMQGDGIQTALAEIVRFFVVAGFFWYLLQKGPEISMSIQDSLRELAASASGMKQKLYPSGIVDIGFDIASRAADQSSVWKPADTTVGLLLAAAICGFPQTTWKPMY